MRNPEYLPRSPILPVKTVEGENVLASVVSCADYQLKLHRTYPAVPMSRHHRLMGSLYNIWKELYLVDPRAEIEGPFREAESGVGSHRQCPATERQLDRSSSF
jgi:hypothetical protein